MTLLRDVEVVHSYAKNWIKLCTDGAVQAVSRSSAVEGVLRYGNGDWIMGYNKFLGECSVFDAELWGILDELSLIQDRCFEGVMIQANSLDVIKVIWESFLTNSNTTIIRRIQQFLVKVGHWDMQHIPRELNKITDHLANWLLIQVKI